MEWTYKEGVGEVRPELGCQLVQSSRRLRNVHLLERHEVHIQRGQGGRDARGGGGLVAVQEFLHGAAVGFVKIEDKHGNDEADTAAGKAALEQAPVLTKLAAIYNRRHKGYIALEWPKSCTFSSIWSN